MNRVIEVVPALADTRRAAVEVDGDSRDAALGEAQRELFVEAVEATNVREDDDADVARLLGQRGEGCEAVAVLALELEVPVVDSPALDRRNRRNRVELEAHAATLPRAEPGLDSNPTMAKPLTAEDFEARMERAGKSAREAGLSGVLVTPGPDLLYLTGYAPVAITERLTMLVLSADHEPAMIVP